MGTFGQGRIQADFKRRISELHMYETGVLVNHHNVNLSRLRAESWRSGEEYGECGWLLEKTSRGRRLFLYWLWCSCDSDIAYKKCGLPFRLPLRLCSALSYTTRVPPIDLSTETSTKPLSARKNRRVGEVILNRLFYTVGPPVHRSSSVFLPIAVVNPRRSIET